ncbi:MAG: tRNA (5-methylaminomethyl-2-thiouridine)(34)-methyltransferase MnmD [Cytophagaceae bacterium]|nr:tRNA (5-methylaminomethyl-2-thiouridine)(34)-methyltransferase MnmD [Cytophagaceae bacterium]
MEQQEPQLILCEDGSHTIFLPALNETYHSTRGAIPESIHVYLKNGYFETLKPGLLKVLEIGYGTGLNALLTAIEAESRGQQTEYHSLEPYPLSKDIWSALNYGQLLVQESLWSQLNEAVWNEKQILTKYFNLLKEKVKLEDVQLPDEYYDVVYFDGFAPRKQAELWGVNNLKKLYQSMKPGARLVTYTAKAQVRRDLITVGFEAGVVKGPPGKKDMILAIKKEI